MDEVAPAPAFARRAGWLAVGVLLAVLGAALHASLDEVLHQPGSDEFYYRHYMRVVGSEGPAAFPGLFRFYLEEASRWIYPSPLRLGVIAVSAAWYQVFGGTLRALSQLSLASYLATIALAHGLAQRRWGVPRALLVALLVAFAPLYLGLARQALTDSLSTLAQLAALASFLEYVREPQRARRAWLAAATFGFAITCKESAVLLAAPLAAHAALERWHAGRDVPLLRTACVLGLPGVAVFGLWVLAAGGLQPVLEVLGIVLRSPSTNPMARRFGEGGWYRYPIDELLMSPWPTMLGLCGAGVALWRWRRGERVPLALAMVLVYVLQVAALSFFTKNLRYAALLEVPLRLLAVGLLWDLFAAGRRKLGLAACSVAVLYLCWTGWSDYQIIYRSGRVVDPVTTLLAAVREIVPIELLRALFRGDL